MDEPASESAQLPSASLPSALEARTADPPTFKVDRQSRRVTGAIRRGRMNRRCSATPPPTRPRVDLDGLLRLARTATADLAVLSGTEQQRRQELVSLIERAQLLAEPDLK